MHNESPIKRFPSASDYLMESEDETVRLDIKTDPEAVRRQAAWCGVGPGMRVLDCGCGPGKTTALLYDMIQPGGSIVGVDFSEERIAYAQEHFGNRKGIEFSRQNFCELMDMPGEFDLIWVRFVLEYFRKEAQDIVKNLKQCLKPGGTLCLLDLDYNSLIHYGIPEPLQTVIFEVMKTLDEQHNFDAFAGRKLYSFLYDNGFQSIDVTLMAHNLIFGEIKEKDRYNFLKKMEIVSKKSKSLIEKYPGGGDQFNRDFEKYLLDSRRFSYTPLLLCKGTRPLAE